MDEHFAIIHHETMQPDGFLTKLRENQVDREGFARLLQAVRSYAAAIEGESLVIDRRVVACLFEAPWEIENTVEHYQKNHSPETGAEVSNMADRLREAMNELLWKGLEAYYE